MKHGYWFDNSKFFWFDPSVFTVPIPDGWRMYAASKVVEERRQGTEMRDMSGSSGWERTRERFANRRDSFASEVAEPGMESATGDISEARMRPGSSPPPSSST